MSDMQAHPVADLFPMHPADELAEMAADIKARGLDHPIVVDDQGRVLDGRNRLAACQLAGVEPTFETYKGDDPKAYALSNNIYQRVWTKGQRALVIVEALGVDFFESKKFGEQGDLAREHGLSDTHISKAVTVVRELGGHDRKAAREGRSGFDATYRKACQVRDIRAEAPDLASQLSEGDLSLAQAQAELTQRRQEQREADSRAVDRLRSVLRGWVEIPVRDDGSGRRARVLGALGDDERQRVHDIESLLNDEGSADA